MQAAFRFSEPLPPATAALATAGAMLASDGPVPFFFQRVAGELVVRHVIEEFSFIYIDKRVKFQNVPLLLEYPQIRPEIGLVGHQAGDPDFMACLYGLQGQYLIGHATGARVFFPQFLFSGDFVLGSIRQYIYYVKAEPACQLLFIGQRFREMEGGIDEMHRLAGPDPGNQVQQKGRLGSEGRSEQYLFLWEKPVQLTDALLEVHRRKNLIERFQIGCWQIVLQIPVGSHTVYLFVYDLLAARDSGGAFFSSSRSQLSRRLSFRKAGYSMFWLIYY